MVIKRCVDDVRDGQQEDVKVFMKTRGENRIEFKTNVQGVSKRCNPLT